MSLNLVEPLNKWYSAFILKAFNLLNSSLCAISDQVTQTVFITRKLWVYRLSHKCVNFLCMLYFSSRTYKPWGVSSHLLCLWSNKRILVKVCAWCQTVKRARSNRRPKGKTWKHQRFMKSKQFVFRRSRSLWANWQQDNVDNSCWISDMITLVCFQSLHLRFFHVPPFHEEMTVSLHGHFQCIVLFYNTILHTTLLDKDV